MQGELDALAQEKGIRLAENKIDDVLTYALFPQVGLKFLEHRDDPDAFEPVPTGAVESTQAAPAQRPAIYSVRVNGKPFTVEVAESGMLSAVQPAAAGSVQPGAGSGAGEAVTAALAGNVFKVLVAPGDQVSSGQPILVVEAMKMETEVSAPRSGTIAQVHVSEGDAIAVGDPLVSIA